MTSVDTRHVSSCDRHTLAIFPKYGSLLDSGQDCWQATRLLKFDILSKISCCLNLFALNVYANYVVMSHDVSALTAVSDTVLELSLIHISEPTRPY